MLDRVGRHIAAYLQRPAAGYEPFTPADPEALRSLIKPGDILLIEGRTHIAGVIKYLTQSTWSHAALYVGPISGAADPDGTPHVLIEANVGEGVTTGLALRLTGAAVIGALAISDPHAEHLGVLIVGGMTGAGLYEAGFIYDLVTLPRSVRRYNKRQFEVQLAPMVTHGTTGLSLAGTF